MTQLEKLLISTLGVILISWMGWISLSVVQLSNKEREDSAQWRAINKLRDFHSIPHPMER